MKLSELGTINPQTPMYFTYYYKYVAHYRTLDNKYEGFLYINKEPYRSKFSYKECAAGMDKIKQLESSMEYKYEVK